MTTINSASKTAVSSSVITPIMPTKTPKKVKKNEFDILAFLLENHKEDNIFKIDIPSNAIWRHVLTNSNIAHLSAMLFLVDSNNVVLYIGQTNHIYYYVNYLSNQNRLLNPATVYVVAHENASKYVHAVTAYRAKFKPTFNRDTNVRFMFNPVKAVLNVTPTNVNSIDWIKSNPDATYSMFVSRFSISEMRKLCRLHSVGKYSYKALRAKLLTIK